MLRHRHLVTFSFFAGATLGALSVSADPVPDSRVRKSDGYGYVFQDDPLAAGGLDPKDTVLKVRGRIGGLTLIRPRTDFVVELLKTVESF